MEDFFQQYSPKLDLRGNSLFDKAGHNIVEWSPSADISETKKEYLVKAELPDVDKADIHVSVHEGTLTIEGERKHRTEENDETYHRVESTYGTFSRSFALPDNIDESNIKADNKNRVLRVHLPKTKEAAIKSAHEITVT
jgi:HSP20 family protein